MAVYDSRRFSQMYSERTIANYEFIDEIVNSKEKTDELKEEFFGKYEELFEEMKIIETKVREQANLIPKSSKGKCELKIEAFKISEKLGNARKRLEIQLKEICPSGKMIGDNLFEVTELLNSMMGTAVLPFEMHREILDPAVGSERYNSEENKTHRREAENCEEYKVLKQYINNLKDENKWYSSYENDKDSIVFGFLKHLRDAAAHSGDDCISILPLDGGELIEEIMFYDINKKTKEEFAMKLSVAEVKELLKKVADFYNKSNIGYIDKTEKIKNAEDKVRKLLEAI